MQIKNMTPSRFYSKFMRVVNYYGQDNVGNLAICSEFFVTCRYVFPNSVPVRVPVRAQFSALDLGDEFCCLNWKVMTDPQNFCQTIGTSVHLKGVQKTMIERYGVGSSSNTKVSHLTSEELISDRVLAIVHALTLIQAIGLST